MTLQPDSVARSVGMISQHNRPTKFSDILPSYRNTVAYCRRAISPARHDVGVIRAGIDAGDAVGFASLLPDFCYPASRNQCNDDDGQQKARELQYTRRLHQNPLPIPNNECRLAHHHSISDGEGTPSGDMTDPSPYSEQQVSHG